MTPAALAIQLLIVAVQHANDLAALLSKPDVTAADLDAIEATYASKRAELQAQIATAKAAGG